MPIRAGTAPSSPRGWRRSYYGRPGLADSLLGKDTEYIRPKEVDLVALISSGVIDYMFQYRSVAIQHGFPFLELA
jgi:molybdate/tungstate transport system substrate-binding protein